MSSRTGNVKFAVVQRLVQQDPETAADMLVRCCHNPDMIPEVVDEIAAFERWNRNIRTTPQNTSLDTSVAANINNTHSPQGPTTPPDSHHSESIRQGSHNIGVLRPRHGSSPSRTGSAQSMPRGSKNGKETILIIAPGEDDDAEEHRARMQLAQIQHSVISEKLFEPGRISYDIVDEGITEQNISIPSHGALGTLLTVEVSARVKLTWRRSKSDSTHSNWFFLVPSKWLEIDVLLGIRDSGEYPPKMRASPYQQGPPPVFQGHHRNSSTQNQIERSWHQSSQTNNDSHRHIPPQPDEILHNIALQQHPPGVASQPVVSATERVQHLNPPQMSQPLIPPNAIPSGASGNKGAPVDRVRLICKLDSKELSMWLDLDFHAGKFIANVQREFTRRKIDFKQAATTILLKADEHTPDEDAHHVSLEEDDLEADWARTIRWVKARKGIRSDPVTMFGVFQVDND